MCLRPDAGAHRAHLRRAGALRRLPGLRRTRRRAPCLPARWLPGPVAIEFVDGGGVCAVGWRNTVPDVVMRRLPNAVIMVILRSQTQTIRC